MQRQGFVNQLPTFSLVIPTYNRPKKLAACLQAISQLSYPADRFEVIVVDDGGERSLAGIVEPYRPMHAITLLTQENAGPAAARNAGAAHANGRFLAFTDDDCRPDAAWLNAFAQAFAQSPNALLGGYTSNALHNNIYATASQTLIDYFYEQHVHATGEPRFFTSNNMAVSAELFHKIGGFDTSYPLAAGEDRDFCRRWHDMSYPTDYLHHALVYHYHNLTAQSFWRQHVNYGRGAFHFHHQGDKQRKHERVRFYLALIGYPLRLSTTPRRKLKLTTLFALTQCATAWGYLLESIRT